MSIIVKSMFILTLIVIYTLGGADNVKNIISYKMLNVWKKKVLYIVRTFFFFYSMVRLRTLNAWLRENSLNIGFYKYIPYPYNV